MKQFKKGLIALACIIVVIVIIFTIINIGTLKGWINDFDAEFYERNWLAFWGSIIGGFLTIGGVFITIFYMMKSADEQDELKVVPYINQNKHSIDIRGTIISINVYMQNIGNGTALIKEVQYDCLNCEYEISKFKLKTHKYFENNFTIPLGVNEEGAILVIHLELKNIIQNNDLKHSFKISYESIRGTRYTSYVKIKSYINNDNRWKQEIIARANIKE